MKKRRLQVLYSDGRTYIGNDSHEEPGNDVEPLLPTTDREYSRDKASKKLQLPERQYDDDVEPLLPPALSKKENSDEK